MKKTGQFIASAAIAAMAMGTLGGGFLVLSADIAAAKSGNAGGGDRGKSDSAGSNSQGDAHKNANASGPHGKGKSRKLSARYLKNLNAMCSKGGGNANANSNVAKIEAFFDAKAIADVLTGDGSAYAAAATYLSTAGDGGGAYTYNGTTFDMLNADQRTAAIDSLGDPATLSGDALDLYHALSDYNTGANALDTQHEKLAMAARGDARATALETADPTSAEGMAYTAFLQRCGSPT